MPPEPLAPGNARVRRARRLGRKAERLARGLFLAEGWQALAEAGDSVVEVFATPAAAVEHAALLSGRTVHQLDERTLATLTDTVASQGLVAVCRILDRPLAEVLHDRARLVVVCANVRDPGNAGTVIRTADAAGADALVVTGDSVDLYNPKTVRATAGSLWHVPLVRCTDLGEVVEALRGAGFAVLAADGAGEVDLFAAESLLRGRHAWLLGNEAWGLPLELARLADHRVRIPIRGAAESLNLAVAGAICLYSSARVQVDSDPEPDTGPPRSG